MGLLGPEGHLSRLGLILGPLTEVPEKLLVWSGARTRGNGGRAGGLDGVTERVRWGCSVCGGQLSAVPIEC